MILLILSPGCNIGDVKKKADTTYGNITIQGTIENGIDQLVILEKMTIEEFVPIDSVRCDHRGSFTMTFSDDRINFYSLKYTPSGYVTLITRPGDRITFQGNSASLYPYSIKGSKDSELIRQLAEAHNSILEDLRKISIESENSLGDPNYVEIKQRLNVRFDSLTTSFHKYSEEFITENSGSAAILIALYNQYGPGLPVFHPLTDMKIYQFADSSLFNNYPENEAVLTLHSQLQSAIQQLRNYNPSLSLNRGERAPDFVLEQANGEKMALSDLTGTYILVQFWASWSKPSVDENRFLEDCFTRFKNRNFSIIQVSIDNNREDWVNAVGTQKPGWYHLSDLQRWESFIVDLYRIERIPSNFLIDPQGIIIEKDIFGDELKLILEKHLK